MCLLEWPAIKTGQVLSPGVLLHFTNDLGYGGTLVFLLKNRKLDHLSNDFIGCDSGECAF